MSCDGRVYYLIFREWLRLPALFNRTNNMYNNFCVTKIKYIMYNVLERLYRSLYKKNVRQVMCEALHFTHI